MGSRCNTQLHHCPAQTGRPWTVDEITAAIDRGPHESALTPEAITHFSTEVAEKVASGQAILVKWEDIRNNPPEQLKISPIAAIPHKSKASRSILDLSFRLRLQDGGVLHAVNDTSTKTAPKGSIDQIGHSLKRIIHAFAEASDDDKIFMAKWDVKDGFWRLQCREGGSGILRMCFRRKQGCQSNWLSRHHCKWGGLNHPRISAPRLRRHETWGRNTSRRRWDRYNRTSSSSTQGGRETRHTTWGRGGQEDGFKYLLEVYVDNFMSLVIPTEEAHLRHVANAVMKGIHDVFPVDTNDNNDPILLKKLRQGEGRDLREKKVAVFSDNDPTVSWVKRLASRHSVVAAQLVRAMAMWMKHRGACPITPVHIPGVENSMTDIPSRSFGSVAEWYCKTDNDLLTLFNARFPLPGQASWTVFQLTSKASVCV